MLLADIVLPWSSAVVLIVVISVVAIGGIVVTLRATRNK